VPPPHLCVSLVLLGTKSYPLWENLRRARVELCGLENAQVEEAGMDTYAYIVQLQGTFGHTELRLPRGPRLRVVLGHDALEGRLPKAV
jgi:hypothetical protein